MALRGSLRIRCRCSRMRNATRPLLRWYWWALIMFRELLLTSRMRLGGVLPESSMLDNGMEADSLDAGCGTYTGDRSTWLMRRWE